MKKKYIILGVSIVVTLAVIISLIFLLKPNKEEKVEEPEKKKVVQEKKEIKIVNLESNSRPYAVMINNIGDVWGYQSGLQDAYIVYEMLVEGGLTRLMAVFKDAQLDRLGSVRSARHYFLDYALENDASYIHFGWSSEGQDDISRLGINNVNFLHYTTGYTRDNTLGLALEHTAFTTTEKIMESLNYYGYRTTTDKKPILNYSADSVDLSKIEGVKEANEISITFSRSRFTSFKYDENTKTYKRYQNGIAQTDYVTKEQYTAKNIITYAVDITYSDGSNRKEQQDYHNIGSGSGWYISEGYAVPITWKKSSRESKTEYRYKNGEEIIVNDGNTHIEIQPNGMIFEIK